ncbi:hypothetical protein D3C75_1325730 [compost metagenome]
MFGQGLTQRHLAEFIDTHRRLGLQPGQVEQLVDQFRTVARMDAQRIARLIAQSRIRQVQGKHPGFLMRALAVQVKVDQQP